MAKSAFGVEHGDDPYSIEKFAMPHIPGAGEAFKHIGISTGAGIKQAGTKIAGNAAPGSRRARVGGAINRLGTNAMFKRPGAVGGGVVGGGVGGVGAGGYAMGHKKQPGY